jgi:hypothetical protein
MKKATHKISRKRRKTYKKGLCVFCYCGEKGRKK